MNKGLIVCIVCIVITVGVSSFTVAKLKTENDMLKQEMLKKESYIEEIKKTCVEHRDTIVDLNRKINQNQFVF